MSCIIRKLAFCKCQNKGTDQMHDDLMSMLLSAFVSTTLIVQFIVFYHLLCLNSLVCVANHKEAKTVFFMMRLKNNKGADLYLWMCRLICAFAEAVNSYSHEDIFIVGPLDKQIMQTLVRHPVRGEQKVTQSDLNRIKKYEAYLMDLVSTS